MILIPPVVNLKKHQFHHYKMGCFPTTSLHLPLLTDLHDSLSNELCHFPNVIPSTKTRPLQLNVYFQIQCL